MGRVTWLRRGVRSPCVSQVAQAQRMFQSTEALLREDVGVLTDSTDTSEVRWLPRPEQATKQKIDSCLRFVALAHEQAAPVEMVEWGLPAADFAKLTRGEAAQRVSLSELRAELHADHSDIV